MRILSPQVASFVFVAALSLGLSQAGMAQAPSEGAPLAPLVPIYRARQPINAPVAKAEAEGRAPSAQAVRIPGFWELQGDPATAPNGGWVWVPGRWEVPPFRGAYWEAGHWGFRDEWWSYIPGHWAGHHGA
jgi:hypothetical protein